MTVFTVPLAVPNSEEEFSGRNVHVEPGEEVMLEREPGDPMALRVMCASGKCLGHVNRQSARWIVDRLDRGKYLVARVAPLVAVDSAGTTQRVQLSVHTEPEREPAPSWWKRLFGG
jgi:hypothetical protein